MIIDIKKKIDTGKVKELNNLLTSNIIDAEFEEQ